jgi:MerR family mercuric resistance operon transcriptional regulator
MVKRVRFIKRAQALGSTLAKVSGLLRLDAVHACAETRALAVLINQKISDLAAMRQAVVGLVQQYDVGNEGAACPIIDMLERE